MKLPHIELAWQDFADIIITAYIVYVVLLIIRGTRGMQILQGISLLLLARVCAQFLHLWTVFSLLNALLIVSGVAIPIVFQPELRRALARLGSAGFHEGRSSLADRGAIDAMCEVLGTAATVLSRSAIGAIIVVERSAALDEYIESGTRVDSVISAEVLLSLFSPRSPLHDGAVIIRRDRICAAGCFLPLSETMLLDRRIGTRHRAALGVTEVTDALAIIVSEETGGIAIAKNGRLLDQQQDAAKIAATLRSSLTWVRGTQAQKPTVVDFARTLLQRVNISGNGLDKTKLRP
ncbi:MAG: diadenylate cyclase CdaA [Candidatus Eremiobacteraeota bacterium]|nr:diadenylate cyclase CdaA [Candidatus Eremiobacteraeota bacterium]